VSARANVPPVNDECDGKAAAEVFDIDTLDQCPPQFTTAVFDTSDATDSNAPAHGACADSAGEGHVYNDIWLSFTANFTGVLTVDLTGSSFDTKVAIYGPPSGNCPGNLDDLEPFLVACNDNCGGPQSKVSFQTEQFTNYIFRVGGASASAKGGVTVTITRPGDTLQCLKDQVAALGGLTSGEVNSLTKKLDLAAAQLQIGKTTPAANRLNAFVNEVISLLGQSSPLVTTANDIIAAIGC
jgi:hypothetical protein